MFDSLTLDEAKRVVSEIHYHSVELRVSSVEDEMADAYSGTDRYKKLESYKDKCEGILFISDFTIYENSGMFALNKRDLHNEEALVERVLSCLLEMSAKEIGAGFTYLGQKVATLESWDHVQRLERALFNVGPLAPA